jgi:hypothetical protein
MLLQVHTRIAQLIVTRYRLDDWRRWIHRSLLIHALLNSWRDGQLQEIWNLSSGNNVQIHKQIFTYLITAYLMFTIAVFLCKYCAWWTYRLAMASMKSWMFTRMRSCARLWAFRTPCATRYRWIQYICTTFTVQLLKTWNSEIPVTCKSLNKNVIQKTRYYRNTIENTNTREERTKMNILSKQLQKANRAGSVDLGFGWGLMPQ